MVPADIISAGQKVQIKYQVLWRMKIVDRVHKTYDLNEDHNELHACMLLVDLKEVNKNTTETA